MYDRFKPSTPLHSQSLPHFHLPLLSLHYLHQPLCHPPRLQTSASTLNVNDHAATCSNSHLISHSSTYTNPTCFRSPRHHSCTIFALQQRTWSHLMYYFCLCSTYTPLHLASFHPHISSCSPITSCSLPLHVLSSCPHGTLFSASNLPPFTKSQPHISSLTPTSPRHVLQLVRPGDHVPYTPTLSLRHTTPQRNYKPLATLHLTPVHEKKKKNQMSPRGKKLASTKKKK